MKRKPENLGLSDKNGEKAMGKINPGKLLQKQMREKGIEAALILRSRETGSIWFIQIFGRQYADTQEEAVLLVRFRYYRDGVIYRSGGLRGTLCGRISEGLL